MKKEFWKKKKFWISATGLVAAVVGSAVSEDMREAIINLAGTIFGF